MAVDCIAMETDSFLGKVLKQFDCSRCRTTIFQKTDMAQIGFVRKYFGILRTNMNTGITLDADSHNLRRMLGIN